MIGSISPDLFYSVGLYNLSTKAHHFIGWFYTAFPLCVVLFILLATLSEPLTKILPIPIELYKKWDISGCIIIALSLFIGAATHILWDSFTHETGSFVRNIHILQYNLLIFMTDGQEIRIYKLLQYLGSILGLLYLWIKYRQYQRSLNIFEQKMNHYKLYKLLGAALLSGGIAFPFALYQSSRKTGFDLNQFVFNQLRLSELIFFILVLIIALWIQHRKITK